MAKGGITITGSLSSGLKKEGFLSSILQANVDYTSWQPSIALLSAVAFPVLLLTIMEPEFREAQRHE